jgi:hypothetical protein
MDDSHRRLPVTAEAAMKRVLGILTGVLMLAGSIGGVATSAAALPSGSEVRCGDTLTSDTILQRDLIDCPDNGLIIGADDVTLDLNGHMLDGNGAQTPCPDDASCDVGVDNTAGHAGVTIRGGVITDFGVGLLLVAAENNVLSRLNVSRQFFSGVVLVESTGGRVERSSITGNGLSTDSVGMFVLHATGLDVERNDLSRNASVGLSLINGSTRNTVSRNRFADNPESGMLMNGDENTVERNVFLRGGGGIGFGGDRNRVTRNLVLNVPACAEPGCGPGLQVEEGSNNVISLNVIHGAPTPIAVEAYGPFTSGTVVSRNAVDGAHGDGISVDVVHPGGLVTGTVITSNIVTRAGDDGIEVGAASATLTGNGAFHNDDLGIEAVAGVTDGGGNHAAGNGNLLQCTNVFCGARPGR